MSLLIVPVETQTRELDAKLLFSCVAAERGFEVLVGSQREIHLRATKIEPGIYIAKDLRKPRMKILRILNALGHRVVAWDEEGINPNPLRYHRIRLCRDSFKYVSDLFSWGDYWARLCRDYPHYPGTDIHVTGNPRVDVLRPEVRNYFLPEAQKLRRKYGAFVLINTNFGLFNHFVPELTKLKSNFQDREGALNGGSDAGLARHRRPIFDRFQEMVPALANAFPDLSIVVRPHPSENHDIWHRAAQGHGNVQVLSEGNVVPWLMASRTTIQNNCTTAVESHIVGTPVITYRPQKSDEYDLELPNSLGREATSLTDVIDIIGEIPSHELGESHLALRRDVLDEHIEALDGKLASDRIVDVLERLTPLKETNCSGISRRYAASWLEAQARATEKRIKGLFSGNKNSRAYETHRFPDVDSAFIQDRVDRLGRQLTRFGNVKVEKYARNIFRLTTRRPDKPV